MGYYYKGKICTYEQVCQYIKYAGEYDTKMLIRQIVANRKIDAERRYNKETDPVKREIMRAMIEDEDYNFDNAFGPEN